MPHLDIDISSINSILPSFKSSCLSRGVPWPQNIKWCCPTCGLELWCVSIVTRMIYKLRGNCHGSVNSESQPQRQEVTWKPLWQKINWPCQCHQCRVVSLQPPPTGAQRLRRRHGFSWSVPDYMQANPTQPFFVVLLFFSYVMLYIYIHVDGFMHSRRVWYKKLKRALRLLIFRRIMFQQNEQDWREWTIRSGL